jgi:hypothetical protein
MLNLLHLLAVVAIAGCLYALWREARGISQSRGHLAVAPPLAFACLLLMIGLSEPQAQQPDILRGAIVAGVALGAARGWFMAVDVDPLWSTVRLPGGRDGLLVGILLAIVIALATTAPLISAHSEAYVPYATAAVALGAGFLSARALAVYLRTRS